MAEVEERGRWSSRTTFILGAVGSAVGLGNLWRFPYLAYKFGGGSFLIPYVICFFFFGVPLLLLEFTLGRKFQGGDPVCFSAMHPRLVGIGWMSAFGSFIVCVYYCALIAWVVLYFFNSFSDPLPWEVLPEDENTTGADRLGGAVGFFFGDVLQIGDPVMEIASINEEAVGASILVWAVVFGSIYKGVQVVSQVVKVSVPLPLLTLVVLLGNSAGKDGASEGIDKYIGQWDFEVLNDPVIWQSAVGQIFFSIGVCFGVMTAYASYTPKDKKGLIGDSIMVAGLNSAISIFAGFVVFTAVGVLANELGTTINDPDFEKRIAGPGLVFIGYPAALAQMDVAPQFFSVIFFLTIFLLAIDSAFSLVEAAVAAIADTNCGRKLHRFIVVGGVCLAGFIGGLFILCDNGLYTLDVLDFYLNAFIMLGVGALECVATTWIYGFAESAERFGNTSVMLFTVITFAGWLLCAILLTVIEPENEDDNTNITVALVMWPVSQAVALAVGVFTAEDKNIGEYLMSGGAGKIAGIVNDNEFGEGSESKFIKAWALLVKYMIPGALIMMMAAGVKANMDAPYEGYTDDWQNLGAAEVVVAWAIFVVFAFVGVDAYSEKNAYEKESKVAV